MPNEMQPILYIECESDDGSGKMHADTLTLYTDETTNGNLYILTGETPKRFIMRHTPATICDFLFGRQGKLLYQNIKLYDEHFVYLEGHTYMFNTNNFANMCEKIEMFIHMLDTLKGK